MRLRNLKSMIALFVAVLLSISMVLSIAGTVSALDVNIDQATVTDASGASWIVHAVAMGSASSLSGTGTIEQSGTVWLSNDLTGSTGSGGIFDLSFGCGSSDTFVMLEGTVGTGQPIVIVACVVTDLVGICPIGFNADLCHERNAINFPDGVMATGTGTVILT